MENNKLPEGHTITVTLQNGIVIDLIKLIDDTKKRQIELSKINKNRLTSLEFEEYRTISNRINQFEEVRDYILNNIDKYKDND